MIHGISAWLAVFAVLIAHSAAGQGEAADGEPPEVGPSGVGNCIRAALIRGSRILNDRDILLLMAEGPHLVMRLKRQCPQLAFHDYFSYEATMGQLCSELDEIVTRAGERCAIGGFRPAEPDLLDAPPAREPRWPAFLHAPPETTQERRIAVTSGSPAR